MSLSHGDCRTERWANIAEVNQYPALAVKYTHRDLKKKKKWADSREGKFLTRSLNRIIKRKPLFEAFTAFCQARYLPLLPFRWLIQITHEPCSLRMKNGTLKDRREEHLELCTKAHDRHSTNTCERICIWMKE